MDFDPKRPFCFVLALLAALAVFAQAGERPEAAPPDPLEPLSVFLGEWRGEEHGVFGEGIGRRSYRRIIKGRYLLGENSSEFPPQEGLPEGDSHADWAIFSYDQGRGTYVLRQFTSEGFVNRYVLEPGASVPEQMVFTSEASENAPAGLRTRLSYQVVSEDEFMEVFEIAPPGQEYSVVIRNRWRRVGG